MLKTKASSHTFADCMVLSIANQKGGVGKTTLAFNLAVALHKKGKRVLLVDNDPQGNLTNYAFSDIPEDQLSVDEVYLAKENHKISAQQVLMRSENFGLIPSDPMLSGVEYYLISRPGKEQVLKKGLEPLKPSFDFILIDNPPSLNLLTINGLVASDQILVPVQPQYFSLEGISQIQAAVDDLKRWHSHLDFMGIVTNMYDDRRRLNSEVLKILAENYPRLLFKTRIHDSVKIAESSGFGKSVLEYSPSSRSSEEYIQLAEEVLSRMSEKS